MATAGLHARHFLSQKEVWVGHAEADLRAPLPNISVTQWFQGCEVEGGGGGKIRDCEANMCDGHFLNSTLSSRAEAKEEALEAKIEADENQSREIRRKDYAKKKDDRRLTFKHIIHIYISPRKYQIYP
jgi:hypothetical protein